MDKRKKSRKQSGSPSADYSAGSANRSGGAPLYRAALERSARKRAVAAETTMQDITNVVASGSRLNERNGQHVLKQENNKQFYIEVKCLYLGSFVALTF